MCYAGESAPRRPAGRSADDPRARLADIQERLAAARAAGADVTRVESLLRLSQHAHRNGDMEEAERLLRAAGAALSELPRRAERPASSAETSPETALSTSGTALENKPQPIFVLPFTHHYNGPGGYYATSSEIRTMGEFFNTHGIPGTLFFDGILIRTLQEESPELLEDIRAWNLPLGYHGEETHGPYPVASDLCAEVYPLREAQGYAGPFSFTTGCDWDTAVQKTRERYSRRLPFTIDPETRMLDRRLSVHNEQGIGGLTIVQQVLGKDVSMMPSHALECAPEGYAFRRMSAFAFDQPAVPTALHALKIFRQDAMANELMSIAGARVSIFWFMGRITSKGDDAGECGYLLPGVRRTIEGLDRSQPRLLLMGYSKMNAEEALRTVRYLERDVFPANPGSGWVSGESIASKCEGEKDYAPTPEDAREMSQVIVKSWNNRPPNQVETPTRVYSLCDALETLAAYRAGVGVEGRISLHPLYGPQLEDRNAALRDAMDFSPAQITAAAKDFLAEIGKQPDAERFVPTRIRVGYAMLNPAEFLQLLAKSVCNDDASVRVTPSQAYPPYADALDRLFKVKNPRPLCYTKGQLWTVKPVRCVVPAVSAAPAGPSRAAVAQAGAAGGNERMLRIVFAANLSGTGRCYREDHGGADLYTIDYSLTTGAASNLRTLAAQPDVAEWFPAISPDGAHVAYTASTGTRGQVRDAIRLVNLTTGKDESLLANAKFPCFSPDGETLAYSTSRPPAICTARLRATPAGLRAEAARVVADGRMGAERVEDPAFLPDGRLVFHQKPDRDTPAALALIRVDGSVGAAVTPPSGAGHASAAPEGAAVAFTTSGKGVLLVSREGEAGWLAPERLALPDRRLVLAKTDARLADAEEVRASYVEWVAPDILLVTAHGSDAEGRFSCARVWVLRLRGGAAPEFLDFSGAVEALTGTTGRDMCTADGIEISGSAARGGR